MKSRKFKKKLKKLAVKHLLEISDLQMELEAEIHRANIAESELMLLKDEYESYRISHPIEVIETEEGALHEQNYQQGFAFDSLPDLPEDQSRQISPFENDDVNTKPTESSLTSS